MNSSAELKSFPSFNEKNFSSFQPDSVDKRTAKKLSLYISTEDNTPQQVIKKDRSNILLRYLYQQLDKKQKTDDLKKRKANDDSVDENLSGTSNESAPSNKLARLSELRSTAADSTDFEDTLNFSTEELD